jgi:hypothetical protein
LPSAHRVHVPPHDGCGDQPIDRKTAKHSTNYSTEYFNRRRP